MIVAVSVVVLACPGVAAASIFWDTAPGWPGSVDQISEANSDGSGTVAGLIANATGPLTASSSTIYWDTGSAIGSANMNGSNVNPNVVTVASSGPIAVDSGHIYWATCANGTDNGFPIVNGTIGRANIDGSDPNPDFISTPDWCEAGLAVNGSYIFWTDTSEGAGDTGIGRANLDGTGANSMFIAEPATAQYLGIAANASYVYWVNNISGAIGRASVDGSDVNDAFIAGPAFDAYRLAVDSDHIYWSEFDGTTGSIARANLDGTGVNHDFIAGPARR